MTEDDRPAFAELMLGLGETYGEPVSDARMEIYFAALRDLPLIDIRRAATLLVRTQKFFPRPSELREGLDGSTDERAEIAWTRLLQEIRLVGPYGRWNRATHQVEPPAPTFLDDAAKRAALELYGSWQLLCENLPGDGPSLLGAAKLFKSTYRAYASRVNRDALPPIETDRELGRTVDAAALSSMRLALKERGL